MSNDITKRAEALLAGLGRYTPADARRLWLEAPDLVRGLLDEVRRLEMLLRDARIQVEDRGASFQEMTKQRDLLAERCIVHQENRERLAEERDALRDDVARLKSERRATIAYLLDRAGQYDNASGYVAFVEEMIGDLADGRHVANHAAGEYDDLNERLDRIEQSRAAKDGGHE